MSYDSSSGDDDDSPPGLRNPALDRPMQCLGPGCIQSARLGVSKYCSEQCGVNLATMRICKALPDRVREWNSTPCEAEKHNRKELEAIRKKQVRGHGRVQRSCCCIVTS